MRKPPTGEPYAGKPHVRFGGRGGESLPDPYLSGHFRHGGNPILRSCFANAVAERDAAENEKLTKASSRGRIDGAVAAKSSQRAVVIIPAVLGHQYGRDHSKGA